jgi:GAF domain-containing protein
MVQAVRNPLELLPQLTAAFDPILCRVWLMGPGDQCPTCALRGECANRTRCLHLEASTGLTTRLDGPFQRFPLGARAMGDVVARNAPFLARADLARLDLAEPAWLRVHGARSFAAVPLPGAREARGALALFSRRELSDDDVRGLSAIATLLAHALADDRRPLREIEREAIERTLASTRGRVSGEGGAARILGLKPTTLHSRMLKLGIRRVSPSRTTP